ncbi:hypothetical protein [Streptococcus agalactiae]|uniref:hypothetical protein n=1 Tax=Streptococcus agalactiae TaxID=1311 RepID=UPI0024153070|nr:hypothetical protein [Streptococcus agalactiae]
MKKITDEQLNQYLEIRIKLGEENFKFINACYDEVLLLKKEEATKILSLKLQIFQNFVILLKNSPQN